MSNTSTLIKKVWNYATILRDSGVAYTDYVAQFTYLLFLKMDDEKCKSNATTSLLPKDCQWSNLLNSSGEELEKIYTHILSTLSHQSGVIGTIYAKAQNKINEPANLKRLIGIIDKEEWLGLSSDVKGDIYEGLLEKNAQDSKGGAGQYFTPRVIIDCIIECLSPSLGEKICDPACGTGGFLLSAYEYIKSHNTLNRTQLRELKTSTLYGQDIAPLVASLCAMNMVLHNIGGEEGNISCADSLKEKGSKYFDIIATNPPFGKKSSTKIITDEGDTKAQEEYYERDDFFATTSNKQLNFLQHIMSILSFNGRAGVVLPDNVLFEEGAGEKIRKRLLANFNLHTILRLPTGIFYAQGVKANVLFFEKKEMSEEIQSKEVWIYDLRSKKRFTLVENPIRIEDLEDFKRCYCMEDRSKRVESERFKRFSYSEIESNSYKLDINWIKEEEDALPSPEEVLESIKNKISDIQKILNNI
ncbi:DNA methyltransferase [Helicobacter anseris]|uniref:site-specific DNA-methyltransferase (adenine-specific) n=1 Tax=Helicobacter anseris TaxID=375926 RepID=A0A3D8JB11_9HELI|nr:class I SAM-dependent DNA methyltransferase [Helicobacter anseris]RDU74054.1 DNA methyltransferase [Helicobacter anseris]